MHCKDSSLIYFLALSRLTGRPAFPGNNLHEILTKNKEGDVLYPPRLWEQISDQAKDLVCKMLDKDPDQRVSATEALNHPWFKKVAVENLLPNVQVNIANLELPANRDQLQMPGVNLVSCTPMMGGGRNLGESVNDCPILDGV